MTTILKRVEKNLQNNPKQILRENRQDLLAKLKGQAQDQRACFLQALNERVTQLQQVRQMPRIRVKNNKIEYKMAGQFFNPEKHMHEKKAFTTLQSQKDETEKVEMERLKTVVSQLDTMHDVEDKLRTLALSGEQRKRAQSAMGSRRESMVRHPRNLETVCKYDNHPFLNGAINPSSFAQATKR